MSLENHVDVLIIGAGPAGLMCANALAIAGMDVRIIDKRPAKVAVGQADGIAPRTIEVLQVIGCPESPRLQLIVTSATVVQKSYGLAERLIREGNQMHMSAFYNRAREGGIECIGRALNVTARTARYPFQITLHQGAIEAIFIDSMRAHGVEVERPKQPVDINVSEDTDELSSMSSYPVKVNIESLDAVGEESKTEIVHAKFVLGSDGAHSWVRRALGIEMEGEQTDYFWGVVDMVPETNFPDFRKLTVIRSMDGTCMTVPREGDLVRFYTQLSDMDVINPLTGRVDKSKMTPQKLISVSRKILHPFELGDPKEIAWWTIYVIGQRVATSYSVKNRVFIAGDTCHTHSPKAGQGMNASMNDTHNLSWKLAHVLKGWSSPSLLKTYEHERRKFAQDLIDFDKEFASLISGKPRTARNEGGVSHEEFLRACQTFGGFTSGISIHYSPSAIVDLKHQKYAENLIIGQRVLPQIFLRAADGRPFEIQDLLPADVRFKVLFFVGYLTQTRISKLNVLAEALRRPSSFLVRYSPEGNVSVLFDVITITAGSKLNVNHLLVPSFLRPHWTKVLLDDVDVIESQGRGGYVRFGIDPEQITIVVVRPDGYVGTIAPWTAMEDLDNYFGAFLIPHNRRDARM